MMDVPFGDELIRRLEEITKKKHVGYEEEVARLCGLNLESDAAVIERLEKQENFDRARAKWKDAVNVPRPELG
jgi:hypothetical protein